MTEIKKRRATLILLFELIRDITVFIDLELKLAIAALALSFLCDWRPLSSVHSKQRPGYVFS
jgi:hypothetical protein